MTQLKGMLKMDTLKPLSGSVRKVVSDPRLVHLLEFPVLMAGGKEHLADLVVGSADYHHIESMLLPERYRS